MPASAYSLASIFLLLCFFYRSFHAVDLCFLQSVTVLLLFPLKSWLQIFFFADVVPGVL